MEETKPRKTARLESVLLVALFVIALSLPGIGLLFKWRVSTEQEEYRQLARFPRLSWSRGYFKTFPENFTAYFSDNFGFRPPLIHLQAFLKLKVFGASSSPLVLAGRDGWLFLAQEYSATGEHIVPSYTERELLAWKTLFEGRRDWLAEWGIRYVFTVLPRKETVYPELVPESYRPHTQSRFDQLLEYMKRHSDVQIVDLRTDLKEAKKRREVYFKTDTHWSHYGGFVGYQGLMRATGMIPLDQIVVESDCDFNAAKRTGDLVRMLGLVAYISEETPVMSVRKALFTVLPDQTISAINVPRNMLVTENKQRPQRVVVFGDSAVGGLAPFLPQNFSRVVMVDQGITHIDPALIESEHPHFVIQIMGELALSDNFQPYLEELDVLRNWRAQKTVVHPSVNSVLGSRPEFKP